MTPFSKKKTSKSIIAKRSVDYSEYQFNKPLEDKIFKRTEEEYDDKFVEKDDAYWVKARPDSLSKSNRIYDMLDKLQQTPKFNRIVNFTKHWVQDIITLPKE
jgi:hypothetical protein